MVDLFDLLNASSLKKENTICLIHTKAIIVNVEF